MVKTPEEIKMGLEKCGVIRGRCKGCPYYGEMECVSNHSADALAYIKQLEDQFRDIPQMVGKDINVPSWISVEERLPEVSDVVLVIANGKPRENITLHNALLIASFWGEEGWIADGFEGWDKLDVSYWMELPEPPKEG